jgi:uncharacterized membrane protein
MTARGSLPLPPPALLSEYDRAFPGLVQKIIEWTEEQRKHRHKLEDKVTTGSEKRMDRGQIIAGVVAVWGLTLAAICAIFGNPYAAGVIAIVAIGGPTAAIFLARTGKTQPPASPPTSAK